MTSIQIVPPQIKVHSVTTSGPGLQQISFHERELSQTMLPHVEPLPRESSWHAVLDHYGLCDSCRQTYRIAHIYVIIIEHKGSWDPDIIVRNEKLICLEDYI